MFFDEIQIVSGWEHSVAALCAEDNIDLYITGSNSKMLSSELSTHISGRFIEIKMLPLSFKEYMELWGGDAELRFRTYIKWGSLPEVNPDWSEDTCRSYLEGVFNTVLIKDVLDRIRPADVTTLKDISRFLYSNIGNETSIRKIAVSTNLSNETITRYLNALCAAFLFYHSEKYDIVGKKLLSTNGNIRIRHRIA